MIMNAIFNISPAIAEKIRGLSGTDAALSRRAFLKTTAAGAGVFAMSVSLTSKSFAQEQLVHIDADAGNAFNLYLSIAEDGKVTIVAMSPEIGQGARTAMPAIVADELDCDWDQVEFVQAFPDPRLGSQSVGGSSAIRDNYDGLRMAGASARLMLERAAAAVWGVDASECKADLHKIVHAGSGRVLGYGELAKAAALLPVPDEGEVRLKDKSEFRYIGGELAPIDLSDIVHGQAVYGIDVMVPGMKYASIERPPVVGGRAKSWNGDAARAVQGVLWVGEIGDFQFPASYQALGGIAVVAENSWAAIKARGLLEIDWEAGPNGGHNSEAYRAELEASAAAPGKVVRKRGDVHAALAAADQHLSAKYYAPYNAHASMEPPVAVADVRDGEAEIWTPNQNPVTPHRTIAAVLGLELDKVIIHTPLAGGGFGRKGKPDVAVEAALVSKEIGMPVQVAWTREDDIRHCYFHSVSAQHMEAGLDKDGKVTAWLHRSAFPPIGATFDPNSKGPEGGELDLGATDLPYDIENIQVEACEASTHTRIGWYRSVYNIFHGFAVNSFMDELAHAAGRDPGEYLLELIGGPRHIDFSLDAAKYGNYGESTEKFPTDTGRMANCVRTVMEKSGWGKSLPKGQGMGIAFHRSFLTDVAAVVHVAVDDDGTIRVPTIHYAIDCGRVVNTERVRAQFEGGAIMGLSTAMVSNITFEDGAVVQSNFHDYEVLRIDQSPEVYVHIVDSDAPPTGVGEPPVPPIAPALANAIFAATGKRLRDMPFGASI